MLASYESRKNSPKTPESNPSPTDIQLLRSEGATTYSVRRDTEL